MIDKNKKVEGEQKNIKENEFHNKKLFQDPEDREKGVNQIMGLEEERG